MAEVELEFSTTPPARGSLLSGASLEPNRIGSWARDGGCARAAKERTEAALGDAVRAIGIVDGDSDALHALVRGRLTIDQPPLDLATLPADAVEQLHEVLLEQTATDLA